jgi:hypothetical protein
MILRHYYPIGGKLHALPAKTSPIRASQTSIEASICSAFARSVCREDLQLSQASDILAARIVRRVRRLFPHEAVGMQKIQKNDLPDPLQRLVEQTEHNIEQLLLHLHALCPDDVPAIKWEGDQWQPDLLNDDIYPQFHRAEDFENQEKGGDHPETERYEVLWALPLCGRDQTKHWHDKIGLANGTASKVLLFHYEFTVTRADKILQSSLLECFVGVYEGYQGHSGSVVRTWQNSHDNTVPIAPALLVTLVEHIENLRHHIEIEKRVAKVIRRMETAV